MIIDQCSRSVLMDFIFKQALVELMIFLFPQGGICIRSLPWQRSRQRWPPYLNNLAMWWVMSACVVTCVSTAVMLPRFPGKTWTVGFEEKIRKKMESLVSDEHFTWILRSNFERIRSILWIILSFESFGLVKSFMISDVHYPISVLEASTAFAKFLQYRIDEKIDALRKAYQTRGIVGMWRLVWPGKLSL